MARSFSNFKIVSAFVANKVSAASTGRGYAAAAQGGVSKSLSSGGVAPNMILKKGVEESGKSTSWVPDPVTGYYRPENQAAEIDAAELRALLLKNKISAH
ncbi:protein SENESCENCE-ASSOCIATED GENE 21, mitochondrial-like [Olea europaea var. sylvestris]|uniref:SENESCENCE-ASSOCIATED GENE 21, mitochondrial-like n=1 Tax=Olea europaea subsp. europaea TaxID=158383 RepID=A0A8S0SXY5_OLEEU|nr:protein SENESCENCE-ASSOCIATED GENE 21, mitochondrial-like [Olea europaea var. sylvestris]CAA2997377.1 SENESCENCE-ASSOCIATED GENE 21, mitochondrial-like [Olea europaea subsp. europaea]